MYNRQETIRRIRQSVDFMVYRRMLIAMGIGLGLGLLYGWGMMREYEAMYFGTFMGTTVLVFTVPCAIWAYRMWKLFREPEEYYFTHVKLTTFQQCWWPRGMCFTVVIDHPEEGTVVARTNPIFRPTGWEQPLLQDYMNKTVTVAYNRETGMVVVIG